MASSQGRARHRLRARRAGVHVWGGSHTVGIILLAEAIIPIGDMLVILAAKGSARSAFGMHGLTALLMILAAVPLTRGVNMT